MPESRVANGNIAPCRFVKLDSSTAGGKVLQAGDGDKVFGISQPESRMPPYSGLDDGYCAIAGENLKVYTVADKEVYLEIGSGGCSAGDSLKSDTNGAGVATTTDNTQVGAIAKQSGNSGDLVPVDLISPARY